MLPRSLELVRCCHHSQGCVHLGSCKHQPPNGDVRTVLSFTIIACFGLLGFAVASETLLGCSSSLAAVKVDSRGVSTFGRLE